MILSFSGSAQFINLRDYQKKSTPFGGNRQLLSKEGRLVKEEIHVFNLKMLKIYL
jgi:hypothetical protein